MFDVARVEKEVGQKERPETAEELLVTAGASSCVLPLGTYIVHYGNLPVKTPRPKPLIAKGILAFCEECGFGYDRQTGMKSLVASMAVSRRFDTVISNQNDTKSRRARLLSPPG